MVKKNNRLNKIKKIILVTGGAGFVGSNLIEYLILKTTYKIISYDNYSSGYKNNHIKSPRIKYLKADTNDIFKILSKYKKNITCVFHFGEFARIHQSFKKFDECLESNLSGTKEVFKFCLKNKIKLIYSATSATLGKNQTNKNLSPYAFSKSKNLELLENLKLWYNFKYEVVYFYNVYGPRQIKKGYMATVIGIFEDCYSNNKFIPVVKPGTQSRRFTHVYDTVKVCYQAWKTNKCNHYSISNDKSFSILQVAKLFKKPIKYLPERKGERYSSFLVNKSLNNKVVIKKGKINLKDYITSFINEEKKKYENS